MTSVSTVVWKMAPWSSMAARSASALTRLPLCASASMPILQRATTGWALMTSLPPKVE